MSNGQEGMYDSGLKGMLEIFVDLILCVIGHDEDTKMELCEQLHFLLDFLLGSTIPK